MNVWRKAWMLFACRYGVGSKAVAGAVREGVKQVYWITDGAEGPRGWKVLCTLAGVCSRKCV